MNRVLCFILAAFVCTACSLSNSGTTAGTVPESYPFDGVKLITPAITDGSDSKSMVQAEYPISSTSHLLIRLEDFSSMVNDVYVNNNTGVNIVITLESSSDAAAAQTSFQVCPVLKNWMMLATWSKAYPMGSDGTWSQAGGDYDSDSCISVTSVSDNTLTFDVTLWFQNYVKGRNENYGMVLISTLNSNILVKGDSDGYSPPRIQWLH